MSEIENKNPWNEIYQSHQEYQYYDLEAAHEFLPKLSTIFRSRGVNTILDLGCGLGRNLIPLAQHGFELVGIDSSAAALDKLEEKLDQKEQSAKLIRGEFQDIPLKENSVDAVISIQTINHGKRHDVLRAIEEISRVVRQQGLIFITVPGRTSQGKIRYCLVKTAEQIEPHTYIPTQGNEKGQPHFIFNKSLLLKFFSDYNILNLWKDSKDYYCLLGENNG